MKALDRFSKRLEKYHDTFDEQISNLNKQLSEDKITTTIRLPKQASEEQMKTAEKNIRKMQYSNGNDEVFNTMSSKELREFAGTNPEKIKYVRSILAKRNKALMPDSRLMASDYKDPQEIEIDLKSELMEAFKESYNKLKEEGYGGSFMDYIKQEIKLQKGLKLAKGGLVQNLNKRDVLDDIILSSAMTKISDAMSGIGGQYFRQKLSGGGSSNNKPKQPNAPKQINLADYFRIGAEVASLTELEREQVNALLQKMLSDKKDN